MILISSCVAYKPFITITPEIIPYGSTDILGVATLNTVKEILKKNTILYKEFDGGIETEEILIDKGTRAKYKFYIYNGNNLKVQSFWGITDAVKSQMIIWAGSNAVSAYSTESWDRATYEKGTNRPNMVFIYGYNLTKQIDSNLTLK
jgi:hypothetical protein